MTQSGLHYRLRVEHALKYKDYVSWKYKNLQRLCMKEIQNVPQHSSVRFGTVGHPEITAMRQEWYCPEKQVPVDLKLTSLILAIWFMDDGTRHRDTVDISVHNFSTESLNYLRDQLKLFQIETTINTDSKGFRLYVLKKSYECFKRFVKPYILKCMAYKLP